MGNPQYTQFLRIIQREGIAQKQKKDSNRKESEEVKYEENEKSHGSVTQLSHGTCNERSSIRRTSSNGLPSLLTPAKAGHQYECIRFLRAKLVIWNGAKVLSNVKWGKWYGAEGEVG